MKRSAITLVELLVALSLASILMMAMAGVLSGLNRQSSSIKKHDSNDWQSSLDRILWTDLAQASGVALDQGVLSMKTPRARHSDIHTFTISYRLVPWKKDRLKLVRSVYTEHKLTTRLHIEQTLAWNVTHAMFERVDDFGRNQPFPSQMGPAPRGFYYELTLANASKPLSRQIVVR